MADRALLNAAGYAEFSIKFTTLYTTKSAELTSKYMSTGINSIYSGLYFDFGF